MDTDKTQISVFGFDTSFLGVPIDLPVLSAEQQTDAVSVDRSPVIDYTHFSLALSSTHKLAYWVGRNIDGTAMQRLSRTGLNFTRDPRIPD